MPPAVKRTAHRQEDGAGRGGPRRPERPGGGRHRRHYRELAAAWPEIAHNLIISETTVKTHVRNVLMKLDLPDRVQAVVLAYESGLVRPGRG